MIVYQAEKKEFLLDYDDRDIEDIIHTKYQAATNRKVAQAEIRSWRESLGYIARVLRDPAIDRQAFFTSPFAAFAVAKAHLLLAREMERFARRRLFRHHHQADTSVSKIEGARNGIYHLGHGFAAACVRKHPLKSPLIIDLAINTIHRGERINGKAGGCCPISKQLCASSAEHASSKTQYPKRVNSYLIWVLSLITLRIPQ